MEPTEIVLGCRAKDRISGFTGRVTGIANYLTGCNQVLIVPEKLKDDGSIVDAHWYDIQRCERIGADVLVLDNGATPGADIPAPIH